MGRAVRTHQAHYLYALSRSNPVTQTPTKLSEFWPLSRILAIVAGIQ
jgi:hypothetical protein